MQCEDGETVLRASSTEGDGISIEFETFGFGTGCSVTIRDAVKFVAELERAIQKEKEYQA